MLGTELLMALAQGQGLRRLDETLGAVGILIEIHPSLLGTGAHPNRARGCRLLTGSTHESLRRPGAGICGRPSQSDIGWPQGRKKRHDPRPGGDRGKYGFGYDGNTERAYRRVVSLSG